MLSQLSVHPRMPLNEISDQVKSRDIHRLPVIRLGVLSHLSESEVHQWVEIGRFRRVNGRKALCIEASAALLWRCAGFRAQPRGRLGNCYGDSRENDGRTKENLDDIWADSAP